jgi:hypothetical protein
MPVVHCSSQMYNILFQVLVVDFRQVISGQRTRFTRARQNRIMAVAVL